MSGPSNPILPGFNPDPSIVRVGEAYYLVTSTFEYLPGIPVHRSTDLVHWSRIGHVITRPEQAGIEHVPSPGGVWAPTIRYRDGVFFVIVSIMFASRGCVVFTATDPAGPWSDGTPIPAVDGIDPDLAWDDDGVAHVTFARLGGGIQQLRVDLDTGTALEPARPLWSGTGLHAPEGPHLYRRQDDWYLLIAEGGTERGHAVSIARGPTPRGPFEGAPSNPVLSARSTAEPVQNVGHADLVETPSGETAMVVLGVRPLGFTRSFSPLGRETFLTRVTWAEGWPIVEPVVVRTDDPPVERVERSWDGRSEVDEDWIAVRRLPSTVASVVDGCLRLTSGGRDLSHPAPAFIGRRQRQHVLEVRARIDARRGIGGLAIRQSDDAWLTIDAAERATCIRVTVRAAIPTIQQSWTRDFSRDDLELFISTAEPSAVPGELEVGGDRISLGVRCGDEEVVLATVDGRHWSFETAESFTGRVVGLFARAGEIDVLDVRTRGAEPARRRAASGP